MFRNLNIAWYLALRQVKRASKWTTILIIFVMVLTFLNLVVVSGILVGLIEGSVAAQRNFYTSDFIITKLEKKEYIEKSGDIISFIQSLPEVEKFSARYLQGGTVEANYKAKARETDEEITNATFAGIDPIAEDELTELSKQVVEGEYLSPDDFDSILVGSLLLKKYTPIEAPGFTALNDVEPGSKVRIAVGSTTREMTVKGVVKSKVDDVSFKVYFVDDVLRTLINRDDQNIDEIAIQLKPDVDPVALKEKLLTLGFGEYAKIQTFADAEPKFLKDIKATFAILGNAIGSIGLAVASITIFIVIFINAITRRKYIGIMKGIGIDAQAIELSYVMQSVFYAICGSAIGLVFLYGFLVPFFLSHPINFPFSDGILVAPVVGTLAKIALLVFATVVAGYIPARMIVRRNTLDAILGR